MLSTTEANRLITEWYAAASTQRDTWENAPGAAALEKCASDLEEALQGHDGPLLTLKEAAEWSGYSARHLQRLVKQGKLANHGRKHAPRFRRCELPKKPGHPLTATSPSPNREEIVRSVVSQKEASDE